MEEARAVSFMAVRAAHVAYEYNITLLFAAFTQA
jgi:hypothetical protein